MLNDLFHGLSWIGLAASNHSMAMYHGKQPTGKVFKYDGNKLSRVVPTRTSKISKYEVTALRSLGRDNQLTSKSDVFSFGVVMMELVSSMPAVDITRHRHDINLSTMAMNRIQNHALHEIVDPTLGFDTDSRVRKMITAVAELAFQCLQHEKDLRPSMVDVLEELKAIQSREYSME
ncbi:hypothetical protein TIFTF001_041978 [Ficus carica]|uniref:Serine-threonine/tyrosine-protein kinase catalytic domain-containing protein n=1 Tax=Ficus carica TaxID=3494 RepID=A0AA88CX74_FICCA|nr:hypothetical protein TIFTF001_041978 [Ficus carica]